MIHAISSLDLKLGARMLIKHPGLTVIATISVAFAIAVGTVGFEIARQALWPTIPIPEGNAIVALQHWNAADSASVRASRSDYDRWRGGLTTITDLSAVEVEERSIAVGAGPGQPETVANVTASTFALTRVPAWMGRTLLDGDERSGDQVVVVGHDFWKRRLEGAADAVGRIIHISGTPVTIVGVMPPGYGFPKRNGVWRPLRLAQMDEATPSLTYVFGRLAPGHSHDQVLAELAAIGARTERLLPQSHRNLRLRAVPLSDAVSELPEAAGVVLASINVFLVLLAALLCGNVAMLLFARTVSRERELLVRTALGASRGRFITQLFAEALLLCAVGAALGLAAARVLLAHTWGMIETQTGALPFWIDTSVSSTALLYAAGLTLFAAAIAGILPALKVTSRDAGDRLRAASSGGGGLQFGGVWTAVIVAQIALTTMLPVPLLGVGADFARQTPAGFPADEFLTATLEMDRIEGNTQAADASPTLRAARLEQRYRALADRLRQEPGVLSVTYADQMPVMRHRVTGIRLDAGPAAAHSERCVGGYCVANVSVDPRFFDVVGAPVIRGRALTTADAERQARVVLVNEFFVDQVMGGLHPIGRRLRFFSSDADPGAESWYEIVGVVPDLGVTDNGGDLGRARVFQPTLPGVTGPLRIAIHVRGDPREFAVRLRELAQATDPALRVIDPMPLPQLAQSVSAFWMVLLIGFTGVTVMLSLAGVYAVMAFSVARRTREIGLRVALGARPLPVIAAVFKRPALQIALGIVVGAVLGLALANNDLSDVHFDDLGRMLVFALWAMLCCALACIVPTQQALRIEPTEALRDEG